MAKPLIREVKPAPPPPIHVTGPMPEGVTGFRAKTRCPDITDTSRSEAQRRITRPIDPSSISSSVPWIEMPDPEGRGKTIKIPAILEVRGTLRDVSLKATEDKQELWSSWNIWGAPRAPNVLQKMADHRMEKLCNKFHARLFELGARKGGWWQVNYCPLGRNGNTVPFLQMTCSAMTPKGMANENTRLTTPPWRRAMFWNPLRTFFGQEAVFPPGYMHYAGIWKEDATIKTAVTEAMREFTIDWIDRVWTNWIVGDADLQMQMTAQGVIIGNQMPTRNGHINATQMEHNNQTLYFKDGDPED